MFDITDDTEAGWRMKTGDHARGSRRLIDVSIFKGNLQSEWEITSWSPGLALNLLGLRNRNNRLHIMQGFRFSDVTFRNRRKKIRHQQNKKKVLRQQEWQIFPKPYHQAFMYVRFKGNSIFTKNSIFFPWTSNFPHDTQLLVGHYVTYAKIFYSVHISWRFLVKTYLSRTLFARTWKDAAQKKPACVENEMLWYIFLVIERK